MCDSVVSFRHEFYSRSGYKYMNFPIFYHEVIYIRILIIWTTIRVLLDSKHAKLIIMHRYVVHEQRRNVVIKIQSLLRTNSLDTDIYYYFIYLLWVFPSDHRLFILYKDAYQMERVVVWFLFYFFWFRDWLECLWEMIETKMFLHFSIFWG